MAGSMTSAGWSAASTVQPHPSLERTVHRRRRACRCLAAQLEIRASEP